MAVLSVRNNNPGNIRDTGIAWEGRTGSQSGFVTFATPAMGVRAMTKNLYSYQNRGLTSVRQMISTWAPPSENNTNSYVNQVASAMGVDPNASIDLRSDPALTQRMLNAMIRVEGGAEASSYFNSHVASGIAMANGTTPPDAAPTTTTDAETAASIAENPTGDADGDGVPNAEDATPAGEPPAPGSDGVGSGGTPFYLDNMLNRFDNYTYRWAIHMVHPSEKDAFEDNIPNRVITLADSGVESEINITNVDQNLALTFNQPNRNAVANQFIFELSEPGGATLFNRILLGARLLGIENHLQASYLLELKFVGYNPDGSVNSNIIGPFYYNCTMASLTFDYKDGGTSYKAELIETDLHAYERLHLHLPQDIQVSASTFGQFLEEFEREINEKERERIERSPGQLFPTEYTLTTDSEASEWTSWGFEAVTGEQLEQTSGISVSGSGSLNFELNQGTSVVAAIATALYQTTNFQRFPIFNGGFGKDNPRDGEVKAESLAQLITWMKLNTSTAFGPYDPMARHYQKKLTYTVGKYITPEIVHDPGSYFDSINSTDTQRERLRTIVREGLIRKRFDYTYTGTNTEVIDLDITLNNAYYQLQALNHGFVQQRDQFFAGAGAATQQAARDRGTHLELRNRLETLQREQTELQESLRGLTPTEQNNQGRASVERLAALESEIQETRQQADRAEQVASASLDSALTNNAGRLSPVARRYITQSDVVSSASVDRASGRDMPLSFYQSAVNSNATAGPDKGDNPGVVMLGAVEINLNTLGDLVEQNIVVRGDPYWLGRPRGAQTQGEFAGANYERGGLNYFLYLNFPTYPNPESGLMEVAEQDFSIMGLYRVYAVQASYRDGQFIMTLSSFRDMATNVGLVAQELISGVIDTGVANQLPGINQQGEGDGGAPGEETPRTPGPELGDLRTGTGSGNVTQGQGGTIRPDPVNPRLLDILSRAGSAAGVDVTVSSGGQASQAVGTGSTRHNHGYAADVSIQSGGRTLSLNNPADVPIIQNFMREARAAGATGLGAGNGYMGNNHYHIDIAASVGQGPAAYWGGPRDPRTGTFISANAPRWLGQIWSGG